MTSTTAPHNAPLIVEQQVRRLLGQGIQLSSTTLGFIEGLLGGASESHFQPNRPEVDDSERMSVLDLLFFPDVAFKTALEPHLAQPINDVQITFLIHGLEEKPPLAHFLLPDEAPMALAMPTDIAAPFVGRLNLSYTQDAQLVSDTRAILKRNAHHQMRVILRDRRLSIDGTIRQTLLTFIRNAHLQTDYVPTLTLLVQHLSDHRDTKRLFESLIRRKKRLFLGLQRHQQQLQIQQRHPMEVLIMQGVRLSGAAPDQMRAEMQTIDRIACSLYGRTEYFRKTDLQDASEYSGTSTTVADFIKRS